MAQTIRAQFTIVLVVFLPLQVCADPANEDALQARALVNSAWRSCASYLQQKNKASERRCRSDVEEAERLLKKALSKNAECRECIEKLGSAYFAKVYFGFEPDYSDALTFLQKAERRYPDSGPVLFFLGCSYYGSGQFARAAQALNRFLQTGAGDPEQQAYAKRVLMDCEARLGGD